MPAPALGIFQLIGVTFDMFQRVYRVEDSRYSLSQSYLRNLGSGRYRLNTRDKNVLGGPSEMIPYFALPEGLRGDQTKSYGGYLRYQITFATSGVNVPRLVSAPDIIIQVIKI